jgi:hypothetical protein
MGLDNRKKLNKIDINLYESNLVIDALFKNEDQQFIQAIGHKDGTDRYYFCAHPRTGDGVTQVEDNIQPPYNTFFFESDDGTINEQGSFIQEWSEQTGLSPTLIAYSGGKSLHYFLRVEAEYNKQEWLDRMNAIYSYIKEYAREAGVNYKLDESVKQPNRLMSYPALEERIIQIGSRMSKETFENWFQSQGYIPEVSSSSNVQVKTMPANFTIETTAGEKTLEELMDDFTADGMFKTDKYSCRCPFHDDKTPSAFVKLSQNKDAVMLHCSSEGKSWILKVESDSDDIYSKISAIKFETHSTLADHRKHVNDFLDKVGYTVFDAYPSMNPELSYLWDATFANMYPQTGKAAFTALGSLFENERKEAFKQVGSSFVPGKVSPNLAQFLTDDESEWNNINQVLKHFCWQVKRKALGYPVGNPLMPVLYSDTQGTGKSLFVRSLIKNIPKHFWKELLKPEELVDPKIMFSISSCLVVYLDDMKLNAKVSRDQLKSLITSETLEVKELYKNGSKKLPNYSTLIASTNIPMSDQLNDPTGNRRYYEIKCREEKITFNDAMINKIMNSTQMYEDFWSSVDPYKDKGYFVESNIDQVDPVKEFLLDIDLLDHKHPDYDSKNRRYHVAKSDLYDEYQKFFKDNNYNFNMKVTKVKFKEHIQKLIASNPNFRFTYIGESRPKLSVRTGSSYEYKQVYAYELVESNSYSIYDEEEDNKKLEEKTNVVHMDDWK